MKKLQRSQAISARLGQTPFVEVNQGAIQIDERGPDLVPLLDKQIARLGKKLQGLKSPALLAEGDCLVAQCLRSFISHAESLETAERFPGQFHRVLVDV